MKELILTKFDKNKCIDEQTAHVIDVDRKYDIILGKDFTK